MFFQCPDCMHTLQGTPTLQHCGRTFFDSVFSTALAFSSFSAEAAGAVSGSSAHPAHAVILVMGCNMPITCLSYAWCLALTPQEPSRAPLRTQRTRYDKYIGYTMHITCLSYGWCLAFAPQEPSRAPLRTQRTRWDRCMGDTMHITCLPYAWCLDLLPHIIVLVSLATFNKPCNQTQHLKPQLALVQRRSCSVSYSPTYAAPPTNRSYGKR